MGSGDVAVKHQTLWLSSHRPNLKPATPIIDTQPSVLAFQAVNKGVEGGAFSGRPNLRPSPHILLCTPRPTLTHPLGLTYTLQSPQGNISDFGSSTALLSSVYPPILHAYHSTLTQSISQSFHRFQHQYIHLSIPLSIQTESQRPLSITHLFTCTTVCDCVSI